MKFIHFGCWGELNKTKKVVNVLEKLNNYLIDEEANISFITLAGDNYYPKKNKINIPHKQDDNEYKFKIYNHNKLIHLMSLLPSSIPTYLLWGNHDILDKTITPEQWDEINKVSDIQTKIGNIESTQKECQIIKGQLDWIQNNPTSPFTHFNRVLTDLSFPNTLVIMIDTTIYEKNTSASCYNQYDIFNSKRNDDDISTLREIQQQQIIDSINLHPDRNHIIFIGHHPIKSWKKKGIIITTHLYTLFSNLIEILEQKNIYYLCADTHLYQHIKLNITNHLLPNKYITINQFVVGTGGAETDKLGKLTLDSYGYPAGSIDDNNDIMIYQQKQEHGFLVCEYFSSVDYWYFSFKGGIPPDIIGGIKKTRKYKKSKNKTKTKLLYKSKIGNKTKTKSKSKSK